MTILPSSRMTAPRRCGFRPDLVIPLAIICMISFNWKVYHRVGEELVEAPSFSIPPDERNDASSLPLRQNNSTNFHNESKNKTTVTAARMPKFISNPATTPNKSLIIPPPNRTCLTEECIQEQAALIARAFPDRHDQEWIVHAPSPTPHNYTYEGILLVKNFKAASSTAAGAILRIASKHGKNVGSRPWIRWHHTHGVEYARRHPQRSFLVSSVRDPAARALSRIFYTQISKRGGVSSDTNILGHLQSNDPQLGSSTTQGGFQLSYLTLRGHPLPYTSWKKRTRDQVLHQDLVEQQVQYILQDYDFLLVAERMDESLVALSMVMSIDLGDVLVNDAKVAGSDYAFFKGVGGVGQRCTTTIRSFRSDAVKQFLESDEWRARSYGDYLLHAAAIQSLDLTIERLGRAPFETRLAEYRRLKQKARNVCANSTFLHCSAKGEPQRHLSKHSCYGDDSGCGYPCIDEMLANETRFGVAGDLKEVPT
jgi:hypothetical protein